MGSQSIIMVKDSFVLYCINCAVSIVLYRLYCIDCAVSIVLYRHYWPDYHDSLVQFPGSVPERVGPSELVDGALHTHNNTFILA